MKWQLLGRNVVAATNPVKATPRTMVIWTKGEVRRFLAAAKEHRLYAAFYTLIATGLRRGELLGLQWEDLQGEGLRIERTLSLVKNKPILSEPKTKNAKRRILITPDVVAVLKEHRERQQAERDYLGEAWDDHGLVFPSQLGTPMNPRNFERVWYALRKEAEVRPATIHDLRHLHVSLLVKNGVDAKTIADHVGHADVAFTLRIYTHVFEEQRQSAALDLAELLEDEEES